MIYLGDVPGSALQILNFEKACVQNPGRPKIKKVLNWQIFIFMISRQYLFPLFLIGYISLSSCNTSKLTFQKSVCSKFLSDVYSNQISSAYNSMDALTLDSMNKDQLIDGLKGLSNKMHSDYGDKLDFLYISSEKTYHYGVPALFFIFKLESDNKFGYYFFYLNSISNRILLVSEFASIKDKRK
jgi:hypothetical protein